MEDAPGSDTGPTVVGGAGGRHHATEVFTVQVSSGGETKEVLVRVERPQGKKPYLGGYRHRVSGMEYHHASAQTVDKKRPDNGVG